MAQAWIHQGLHLKKGRQATYESVKPARKTTGAHGVSVLRVLHSGSAHCPLGGGRKCQLVVQTPSLREAEVCALAAERATEIVGLLGDDLRIV